MEPILETEDPNIPLAELSKEELVNKRNSLFKVCESLRAHSEDKSRQIYDYKKELAKLHNLETEYKNEIESLQTEKLNECEKLKLKIQRLKQEVNDLNDHDVERIESFEQSIFKRDEEVCRLEDEIQSFLLVSNSNNNKSELDELQSRNTDLKNVMEKLNNEIVSLKGKTEFLEKQCVADTEQTNNLQEDLAKVNESYKYKREELHEIKQLNETFQEDLALIKQELEAIHCRPLQNKLQTNSLFAEVDDKRLKLQDKVSVMKSQYLEMKSEHGKLLAKIASLNSTNTMLSKRWENESWDRINDDDRVDEAYKERIKLLEFQHEICKRVVLNCRNITIASLENLLEAQNKEMKKVIQQSDNFFLSKTILSSQLRDSEMEMKNWETKMQKFKLEIEELRIYLEDIQSRSMSIESAQVNVSYQELQDDYHSNMINSSNQIGKYHLEQKNRNVKDNSNTVNDCNKENIGKEEIQSFIGVPKKVGFADDIIDHTDVSKSKLRKGCKIIHCKPMVLKKKS